MTQQLALPMTFETEQDRLFREFHRANPEVYVELRALAKQAVARGRKRLGIRQIWEVMRWNLSLRSERDDGDYKLNNNHTSRYARKLMAENVDLYGLFDTRELRS